LFEYCLSEDSRAHKTALQVWWLKKSNSSSMMLFKVISLLFQTSQPWPRLSESHSAFYVFQRMKFVSEKEEKSAQIGKGHYLLTPKTGLVYK
jgi:hypothetical protein